MAGTSGGVAGTRVAVPGGSYRDVTPRGLAALLRHKAFVLVDVHVPYAGEIAHTDRFLRYDTIAPRSASCRPIEGR